MSAQKHLSTVEKVAQLPFAIEVRETDRQDSTHRVETRQSVLRQTHELMALEDAGADVMAISKTPPSGLRVYVSL